MVLVLHKRHFRSYLGREAMHQTVRHVAQREEVGEGLVRRCVTEVARVLLGATPSPEAVAVLGLDEFSIRKGQVYDTAIMDIKHKQVIGVVSGHRQKEVAAFFTALPKPEEVEVVVMDLHEPFPDRSGQWWLISSMSWGMCTGPWTRYARACNRRAAGKGNSSAAAISC